MVAESAWRDAPCSWTGRLSIVSMSVLSNFMYRFNAIPIKIPATYFMDIDNVILKFTWRRKRLRIAKTILKGRTKLKDYPATGLPH